MDKKEKCPDCGVAVGEPHENECDVELCSTCGGQRISCDCETHDPSQSIWTGEWPSEIDHGLPQTASGFDFTPMSDGRFLLEFYAMDGHTFAEAVLTQGQVESLREVIAVLLDFVQEKGFPETTFLDQPNRHREEIAEARRRVMGVSHETH